MSNSKFFFLIIYFLNYIKIFLTIHGYMWILKKYASFCTDMDTGTGRIFIQRVGYKGTTIRDPNIKGTFYKVHNCIFFDIDSLIPWTEFGIEVSFTSRSLLFHS